MDGKNYQVLDLPKQTVEIQNAAELAGIAKLTNAVPENKKAFQNVTFSITADINLDGHYWLPIGDVLKDGNAYKFGGAIFGSKEKADATGSPITISNMSIDLRADQSYHSAGFIGGMSGGSLKNLYFVNSSVKAYAGTIATAVGMATGGVTVENIHSDAKVILTTGSSSAHDNLGGIVGKAQADKITISDCVFTGTLQGGTATEKAGGILGATNGGDGHLIRNCVVISEGISGGSGRSADFVAGSGGVIGVSTSIFTVENCYVNAVIALPEGSDNERVGGIVGAAWSGGTLKNVQFDGVVSASGKRFRGAFIGAVGNPDKTVTLTNCLNTGISAGYDNGKLLFSLISNMNSSKTTIKATNVYSTSEILLMAEKVDLASCKSYDELAGDSAKKALSGFDFDAVWTVRTDKLPILTIAKDFANDSEAAIADFSWFKPEAGAEMRVTNERQLIALQSLVKACGKQLDTFLSTNNIKIENVLMPLLSRLFDSNTATALKGKTVSVADSSKVVSVFAQTSKAAADGSYAVRFVAEIAGSDWASAGFELLVSYTVEDGTRKYSRLTEQAVTVCYQSILADGTPIAAPDGHYYLVFVLNGIPTSYGDVTFTVSAHVEDGEGNSYANAGSVVFASDGKPKTN